MIYPSKSEFLQLAKKGNLIPVYGETFADFETPLSVFAKIDKGDHSFLLESVEGGERLARYSFLGSRPSMVFSNKGPDVEIHEGGSVKRFTSIDPVAELRKIISRYRVVAVKGLPRFCGGLVGYFGYDTVRFFEDIPDRNPDDLKVPDSVFMLTENILVFDHVDHKIKVVSNVHVTGNPAGCYDMAVGKIRSIIKDLKTGPARRKQDSLGRRGRAELRISSNFTRQGFTKAVKKAKEYIRKGDIIQAVLSQRFSTKTAADPFRIYRALRSVNPSPYMYYLKLKDFYLIGSSPEIMVRCEDGKVEVRPIAGTRPRGSNDIEDDKLIKDLLADPKERAEHIMLVDLGRNDIGRVCDYKTIKVSELMTIEKYSHVMHIVTDVAGRLRKNKDAFDVIRATFPAGTVSGAPKVRAMEIIDELEKTRRGPYAGCVGYFSFSGNLDFCITIRTILMKGDKAYIQAGAGLVADSRPAMEYQETVNKAKALFKAIELAEKGLE